jgi:hypothetical protein
MSAETGSPTPRMEIRPARVVTFWSMLALCAYGFVVLVPLLLAAMVVSVHAFGNHTLALPLIAFLVAVWFLPFGFGNPHVTRLVAALGQPPAGTERFTVQLKLSPPLATGFRAAVDDADDYGSLILNATALTYHGDSVTLVLPYESIQAVQARSIGWRGLFLYSPRITLAVQGLPNLEQVEFTERSSWTLPGSRKKSQALFDRLRAALKK